MGFAAPVRAGRHGILPMQLRQFDSHMRLRATDGRIVSEYQAKRPDQALENLFGWSGMPVAIHPSHSGFRAIQKIGTVQASSGIIRGIPAEMFAATVPNSSRAAYPLARLAQNEELGCAREA